MGVQIRFRLAALFALVVTQAFVGAGCKEPIATLDGPGAAGPTSGPEVLDAMRRVQPVTEETEGLKSLFVVQSVGEKCPVGFEVKLFIGPEGKSWGIQTFKRFGLPFSIFSNGKWLVFDYLNGEVLEASGRASVQVELRRGSKNFSFQCVIGCTGNTNAEEHHIDLDLASILANPKIKWVMQKAGPGWSARSNDDLKMDLLVNPDDHFPLRRVCTGDGEESIRFDLQYNVSPPYSGPDLSVLKRGLKFRSFELDNTEELGKVLAIGFRSESILMVLGGMADEADLAKQNIKLDRAKTETFVRQVAELVGGKGPTTRPDVAPKSADDFLNRGNDLAGKGDLDKAIADFTMAIEGNPKFAQAFYNRGLAFQTKGEIEKAITDYDMAIKLDPKLALAYNNRGAAHRDKGDFDKAIADYTKAIGLNPQYADTYTNRGTAYVCKGDYDKALADCNTAIGLNPQTANPFITRAIAFAGKKDYEKAWSDVQQAQVLGGKFTPDFLKALRDASENNGAQLRRPSLVPRSLGG